ncbi:MAG: DNA alkylation repair protein [Planctomycetales bacterium]|nr:DNA alkylation repair protein [Planctomycetales bacterium]MCA9226902.1 DNA alkylation repair protein [Planctomycetales bacterium]
MNRDEVMHELETLGTAQNVKIYKRHGAGDNLFGVSFANLNKLKKRLRTDHSLACELWETANTDAQTLALMIADAVQLSSTQAESWLKEISYPPLADMLAEVVARSKHADAKQRKWMKAKRELTRLCGYSVLSHRLRHDAMQVSDEQCLETLEVVERELAASPNRARHAMNAAIIGIGVFKPHLAEQAIEAARRIGPVQVDHGETSCQTPDAESYIRKALAHQAAKGQKKPRVRRC